MSANLFPSLSRRGFVTTCSAGLLAGLGDFGFLSGLPAAEAVPRIVPLKADIEPLVRFIEDTPRKDLIEKTAEKVRAGTSYQDLLAALFLAGVRGIQPRPVGFKFHAVLVINAAHQASLAATDRDHWLPLFWSLDNFKSSQERNKAEGDWRMPPVAESKLPPAHAAKARFLEAMEKWDEEGADVAVAALARSASQGEVFELFYRLCARDFRDIGHKVIYTAYADRLLGTIGWRHGEPVVRSLAYALLERGRSATNPSKADLPEDRPGRENRKRAMELPGLDRCTTRDNKAATELLETLRKANASDASAKVAELLRKGIDPQDLWDGLFLGAGEWLACQPGIVGLHCVTSMNSLHHGFQASADDQTRKFLLLQGAAFLPLFRQAMAGRGKIGSVKIDALEKAELKGDEGQVVEEIFADIGKDRLLAARKTLALVEKNPGSLHTLMAAARRLIFAKGRDAHDYKFSSAALEDYYHVSPAWRANFVASSVFNLIPSTARDSDLIARTREALAKKG